MFDKLASTPTSSVSSALPDLSLTTAFLSCVVDKGFRLSYGALAHAARVLGEDENTQILAQRGGKLVTALAPTLQPFVCKGGKKLGKYSKGVVWSCEVPSDLGSRPVLEQDAIEAAIKVWQEASAS